MARVKAEEAEYLTPAERTKKSVQKRKDAGLMQIKVWVDPEEADAVRKYAARKPLTKEILKEL